MHIADEVEAALHLLQDALERAEATLAGARSRADADAAPGLFALEEQVAMMRLELARLRREFGVQVARLVR